MKMTSWVKLALTPLAWVSPTTVKERGPVDVVSRTLPPTLRLPPGGARAGSSAVSMAIWSWAEEPGSCPALTLIPRSAASPSCTPTRVTVDVGAPDSGAWAVTRFWYRGTTSRTPERPPRDASCEVLRPTPELARTSSPECPARSCADASAWARTPATSIWTPSIAATPSPTAAAVSAALAGREARLRVSTGRRPGSSPPVTSQVAPPTIRRVMEVTNPVMLRETGSEVMPLEPADECPEAGGLGARTAALHPHVVHNPAVGQDQHPVRVRGHPRVLGDQDGGPRPLAAEAAEHLHH